jgi:hypothetical protein
MRIIAFIEDQQVVKKILRHLDLWHVKRKPPPRANGPPAETIIIYDQSSAPRADDYLVRLRRIIRMKPTFKKIQLRANPPEADRICLNTQFQLKKSILTTKPAYVIRLSIGAV